MSIVKDIIIYEKKETPLYFTLPQSIIFEKV